MKKIIILLVFSITVISVFGQRKCGSELNLQQIQQTDKVRYQQIISFEKKCRLIKERMRTRGFLKNEKILIPVVVHIVYNTDCLLYTSPSPRDGLLSRMPSSA